MKFVEEDTNLGNEFFFKFLITPEFLDQWT
jgi:hypothetical protein